MRAAFKHFSIHSLFMFVMLCLLAQPVWADDPAQHPPGKAPAPAEDPNKIIATVLGKDIAAKDRATANGLIVSALMNKYAEDHKIVPTETEIDTFIERTDVLKKQQIEQIEQKRDRLKEELADAGLKGKPRQEKEKTLKALEQVLQSLNREQEQMKGREEQMRAMKRRMAGHFVRHWKLNKALYEQYGGRVIFQQAGPEPLDAYRDFLKEQEKAGAFKLIDPSLSEPFWHYFTNDAMHTFYPEKEGDKFIQTPWWTMDAPPLK